MNFNMFGIPFVGPDSCGFFGAHRDDELCTRWIQAGTFFPFLRQHHDINEDPSELWRMDEPWKSMARNALYDRLQYVR